MPPNKSEVFRVIPSSILLFGCMAAPAFGVTRSRFQVSSNGRYLQYSDGKLFFYLPDTAWAVFHRLSREEATRELTGDIVS
jgi:hypothetical protein